MITHKNVITKELFFVTGLFLSNAVVILLILQTLITFSPHKKNISSRSILIELLMMKLTLESLRREK